MSPSKHGEGKETSWPNPVIDALQKTTKSSDYRVNVMFSDDNQQGIYPVSPASLSDYLSWNMGENVILDVNNLGGVSDFHRE